MKKLFLIRHAKSSWKEHGTSDHERPLNERGLKDAPHMAKLLKKTKVKPDLILTSDALRAKTTAEIFAEIFNYPKEEILVDPDLYLASQHNFLKQINLLEDTIECCFLFSHNPGISEFVYFLAGEGRIDMPTCAVCGIEFDVDSWRQIKYASGKVILYEYPKKEKD